MQRRALLLLMSVAAASCKHVECADGTIERDGQCEPSTKTTSSAVCGPFTELLGDRCVPLFSPTVCDPATTMPNEDSTTGVTTCIGTGGGGCNAPFACPTPSGANRLTICGQLFDLETNAKFQGTDATGTACDPSAPTANGPCALGMRAYDALQFAANPAVATPRPVESVYIDDCGRYRVVNIDTNGTSPFIGLGIDDVAMPGPGGVTVTIGVATPRAEPVVSNFEAWIVSGSTVQKWTTSGGPPLAGGIYVATYRKHKLRAGIDRHLPETGVTFGHQNTTTYPGDDFYFLGAQNYHQTIDAAASVTGANGSALVKGRTIGEGVSFTGQGGLGAGCAWEPHAAASLPGIVFVQVYRKVDVSAGSCQD